MIVYQDLPLMEDDIHWNTLCADTVMPEYDRKEIHNWSHNQECFLCQEH